MLGYNILLGNSNNVFFDINSNYRKYISFEDIICESNMISKFEKDKVFYKNNDYVVILDGAILNKTQIMKSEGCDSWPETILSLYQKEDTFFSTFRGSFSGLIYDKKKKKSIIYTDQIGSKFIYYTRTPKGLFVSSMMPEIYRFLKINSLNVELDEEAAYMLLSYGYMIGNKTLCTNVYKLNAGCYLVVEEGKLREERYCMLNNMPDNTLSEESSISMIDEEFRRVIKMEFEKDSEYGYRHLVSLSAGLDSRMTSWVAHEMGYTDQINITFSQSEYLDETIAQKIASDLKHEWIFKSLDDAKWLEEAENVTKLTGGNVLFYGLAHSNSLMKYLNYESLGMLHTGQLGDVVVGTFYDTINPQAQFTPGDGAYSKRFVNKISKTCYEKYANQEIAKFYHRGFNGTNCGLLSTFQYTETYSPFMDWDFMNNILRIPLNLRYGHNIYKKWILKCYPDAAKYIWEKIGCRINRKIGIVNYKGHSVIIEDIPKKILYKMCPQMKFRNSRGMNPIGYYMITNEHLKKYIEQAFCTIPDLKVSKELKNDLSFIKEGGTPVEVLEAISLLKAIELMKS